ncbi:hypothetical protein [Alicyclobacillus sacchari]|uniref:hypothetical protein n=1 Tax=Alicyclobacillus sacchari TaxID=392010 RepID=UPI0032AF71C9
MGGVTCGTTFVRASTKYSTIGNDGRRQQDQAIAGKGTAVINMSVGEPDFDTPVPRRLVCEPSSTAKPGTPKR